MEDPARHPLHQEGHRCHRHQVAGDGCRVGADHRHGIVDEALEPLGAADLVEPVRQRGRRHGRLLGGQREMREVDAEKAGRIVDRGEQPFGEPGQVRAGDEELEIDRDRRDHTAAGRGLDHRRVLLAVARDVVLAGLGGALHHLARQVGKSGAHQIAHAAAMLAGRHQLGRQVHEAARGPRIGPDRQQQVDAAEPGLHALHLEHHLDRHAVLVQVLVHARGGGTALVEPRAEGVQALRQALRTGGCRIRRSEEDGVGRLGQLVERRIGDVRVVHAGADGARQARRPHLAHQDLDAHRQAALQTAARRVVVLVRTVRPVRTGPEQPGQACHELIVQAVDPVRVAFAAEQQREQRGQLRLVGRRRQETRLQAVDQLTPETRARRQPDIAQQRHRIVVPHDRPQRPPHAPGQGRVVVQHLQQVAQPRIAP